MKILLDTHILLWALSEPDRIDDDRRFHLEDLSNIVYVSSVSIAEIVIKNSLGKLEIDFDLLGIIKQSGFEFLDFTAEEAMVLKDLPLHHKDPFDRMLIAQSIVNKYPIVTDENKFTQYDCTLI